MRPGPLAMLLASAVAACAAPTPVRPRIGINPPLGEASRAALASASRQVRSCYRAPRVSSESRLITTRLRVLLAPDGTLGGLPEVVAQTGINPVNQPFAARMAEAAILAVIRCAPYRLPSELAGNGLIEIELTFSPGAAV